MKIFLVLFASDQMISKIPLTICFLNFCPFHYLFLTFLFLWLCVLSLRMLDFLSYCTRQLKTRRFQIAHYYTRSWVRAPKKLQHKTFIFSIRKIRAFYLTIFQGINNSLLFSSLEIFWSPSQGYCDEYLIENYYKALCKNKVLCNCLIMIIRFEFIIAQSNYHHQDSK